MRFEVLTIGDELLDGRVIDTNTVRLAQALSTVGAHLSQRTSITDDIDTIVREAQGVAARGTSLCVVSGGLGPTTDDLTAAAFAKLVGVELVRDPDYRTRIIEMLQQRGREVNENHLKQADRPQGAELLVNHEGSAPGFALEYKGCRFVAVPGIPKEFDGIVSRAVIAPLTLGSAPVQRRALYCIGVIEAETDRKLQSLQSTWPTVRLQYRVKFPELHITMHAPPDAAADLDAAFAFARDKLHSHVYATHLEGEGFAAALVRALTAHHCSVAAAESCTGGLIGDLITDIPGSSGVFMGSITAYGNDAKISLLGVLPESLQVHGAVSEAVVLEMARGAHKCFNTTYAVSTSGIAGPNGGSDKKPVGTIWLGCVGPNGERTHKLSLPFERRGNKLVAAHSALDLIRRALGPI